MQKPENGGLTPIFSSGNNPNERNENTEAEALKRRERFARALTRSVFGRHYWDDGSEAELQRAMRRPKQKRKN